jgi:hypothetical protein
MSLDLTPEEEKAILEARRAKKTEEQIAYEKNVADTEKTYQQELKKVKVRNTQTQDCFNKLKEAGLDIISLKKETVTVSPYKFQIEKLKEGDYKITEEDTYSIWLSYTKASGSEHSEEIVFELDRNGRYKISVPYKFNHSFRTYVVKTAVKKIKEGIELETRLYNEAEKKKVGIRELIERFQGESPAGTEIKFFREYIRNNYSGGKEIDTIHIKYPNGNSIKLRVYSDLSYSVLSKEDVSTKDWEADEWMQALKK